MSMAIYRRSAFISDMSFTGSLWLLDRNWTGVELKLAWTWDSTPKEWLNQHKIFPRTVNFSFYVYNRQWMKSSPFFFCLCSSQMIISQFIISLSLASWPSSFAVDIYICFSSRHYKRKCSKISVSAHKKLTNWRANECFQRLIHPPADHTF